MTKKDELKIVHHLVILYDRISKNINIDEIMEDDIVTHLSSNTLEKEDIEQIIENYIDYDYDMVNDKIIDTYFESNFEKPLPSFLYEEEGDIFGNIDYGERVTEEYFEWIEGL